VLSIPCVELSCYRVLWFSEVATIARPPFYAKWVLSEDEPLENILRRFQRHSLAGAMASPSTANPSSSSRTREPPKMRSHSQLMEESGSEREDEVRSSMDYLIP